MLAIDEPDETPAGPHAGLAPRPTTVAQTGHTVPFLIDLAAKHLLSVGVLTPSQLVGRLALAGPIVGQVLQAMRAEALVETRMKLLQDGELRFGLTECGRAHALDATARAGYLGPAPVPLADYERVVQAQSRQGARVTRGTLRDAFRDVVIADTVLDQFGPALNSGRSIFIYGGAGTGKTFIGQRLIRVLGGEALVPHAISVGECIVRVFDPLVHRAVVGNARAGDASLLLRQGFDPRYVACERPMVVAGGEMHADMLEVSYDGATREYSAPLQLKANGGLLLIDDLGRQRISPAELFNRWIVPMEEGRDFLALAAGRHFSVPFDVRLVFSTNFDPSVLADEAFLRRIGYKIELAPITPEQYGRIWRLACASRGVEFDQALVDYAVESLHVPDGVPLLPCHPRDLCGMALDYSNYLGEGQALSAASLRRAWDSYFVRHRNAQPDQHALPARAGEGQWQ